MIRLAATAVSTVVIGALCTVLPASAAITCDNPSGSTSADADSVDTTIKCPARPSTNDPGDPGGKTRTGKGAKPACVWVPKPDYQAGAGQPVEGKGGHWYQKFCTFGDYKTLAEFQQAIDSMGDTDTQQTNMLRRAGLEVRFFTTPPEAPRPTPLQVMYAIYGRMDFPKTFLAVSPAPAKQVVGLPTWIWLTDANGRFDPKRYAVQTDTIAAGGYELKWQIVPQVTLASGVGEPQTCDGAGVPWSKDDADNPDACTVTYDKAGKYTLTANVTWTVRWWLAGESQDPIPGPTNTATQAITVGEIQTVTR